MKSKRLVPATVIFMCSLAACSLPRGAAMQREIMNNSTSETPSFAHYPVDSTLLASVADWPAGKGAMAPREWVKGGIGSRGQVLAAGDTVQIAVWENGDNKLLSNPGVSAAQLQPSTISAGGSVFVPYIGPVKVAGLTPDAARKKIQAQIAELTPAAQVQLEAAPGKANTVALIGGVARPGNVPFVDHSMTVLGLVSEAGGVLPSIENPQLRLLRAGKVYEISMQRVLDDPTLDAGVRPGDKLIVEKDARHFLALGAAGREQVMPFPKDTVNALEAVTLVGGINDMRADPKGVLILREYPATAVHADGDGGPTQQRVVFTIDLTSTDGLFSAQNFQIQPDDLVLATESPLNNLRTIIGLLNASTVAAINVDKLDTNLNN